MGAHEREDGAGSTWWLALLVAPLLAALGGGLYLWRAATHEEALARMSAERSRQRHIAAVLRAEAEHARLTYAEPTNEPGAADASGGARKLSAPDAPVVEPDPPSLSTIAALTPSAMLIAQPRENVLRGEEPRSM